MPPLGIRSDTTGNEGAETPEGSAIVLTTVGGP